jgi:hypothetical protein
MSLSTISQNEMTFCFPEAQHIFSSLFVASTQQLTTNAGHSFTAHTLRFVLQGGVDSGKVHPRKLEYSSVEFSKFISTMEIKNLQSTQNENKLRMGKSPSNKISIGQTYESQVRALSGNF